MSEPNAVADNTKTKALTALAITLLLTVGVWFFFNHATDRGLARLQSLDRVWAVCDSGYKAARTSSDTGRIDTHFLSEVIDSGSTSAPRRCVDMRRPIEAHEAQDSVRRADAVKQLMPSRDRR